MLDKEQRNSFLSIFELEKDLKELSDRYDKTGDSDLLLIIEAKKKQLNEAKKKSKDAMSVDN